MDEEIKNIAAAQGKKLACLLSVSKLTAQQQEEWLAVIDKMSLEQIDRLVDILQNQWSAEGLQLLDSKLTDDLIKLKDDHLAKIKDIDDKAESKIKQAIGNA